MIRQLLLNTNEMLQFATVPNSEFDGAKFKQLNKAKPLFSSQIQPQILLCKKKIPITSKYRHMYGVLNVDEI
jgi:hypothetical protein